MLRAAVCALRSWRTLSAAACCWAWVLGRRAGARGVMKVMPAPGKAGRASRGRFGARAAVAPVLRIGRAGGRLERKKLGSRNSDVEGRLFAAPDFRLPTPDFFVFGVVVSREGGRSSERYWLPVLAVSVAA